ncbi:hypothetical protein A2U01_0013785 [Trifolium medium]|uniref:Uncharacterized protein n=1 Tax=Trifolium medium TaxID=97028 RepID=A0A392MZT4_9FABA|nr:hypothetical protein [Trifolium medium]
MENNGEVGDSESKIEISDDSLRCKRLHRRSASLNVFNAEEDSASHNGEVGDSESKIQISKIQIGGNSDSEIDDLRRSIKGLNVFNVEEDSASHSSADNILFKNYEEVSVHRNMLQGLVLISVGESGEVGTEFETAVTVGRVVVSGGVEGRVRRKEKENKKC